MRIFFLYTTVKGFLIFVSLNSCTSEEGFFTFQHLEVLFQSRWNVCLWVGLLPGSLEFLSLGWTDSRECIDRSFRNFVSRKISLFLARPTRGLYPPKSCASEEGLCLRRGLLLIDACSPMSLSHLFMSAIPVIFCKCHPFLVANNFPYPKKYTS